MVNHHHHQLGALLAFVFFHVISNSTFVVLLTRIMAVYDALYDCSENIARVQRKKLD